MKRLGWLLMVASSVAGWQAGWGQAAAVPQGYDVVTIKPNLSGSGGVHVSVRTATFLGENVPLPELIGEAYRVQSKEVVGLPKWAEDARYDVNAKVVDPGPAMQKGTSDEERSAMLAAVLEDRFGLKMHRETRILPVYELTVAKGGPKFAISTAKPLTEEEKKAASRPGPGSMSVHNGDMTGTGVAINSLALDLSGSLDRTVVDKTGLAGKYDFHMRFLPEGRPELADSPPGLFTALEEQMGLKLVPGKGPVEVVVVDAVKAPTEN